jgi:hypothetical protein
LRNDVGLSTDGTPIDSPLLLGASTTDLSVPAQLSSMTSHGVPSGHNTRRRARPRSGARHRLVAGNTEAVEE